MSEIESRHHQEVKIPVPPIQDDSVQAAIEDLQARVKTYEDQLTQYQRVTESLRGENKEIMARYMKLQVFEDLLQDPSKYKEVLLKDPLIAAKLEARCKEAYGTVDENLVTTVAEECLRQGLLARWHITKRELDRKRG